MNTIAEVTLWSNRPVADRLNPLSPLALDVLNIDPTPHFAGATLETHVIFTPKHRPRRDAFERVQHLLATGSWD